MEKPPCRAACSEKCRRRPCGRRNLERHQRGGKQNRPKMKNAPTSSGRQKGPQNQERPRLCRDALFYAFNPTSLVIALSRPQLAFIECILFETGKLRGLRRSVR